MKSWQLKTFLHPKAPKRNPKRMTPPSWLEQLRAWFYTELNKPYIYNGCQEIKWYSLNELISNLNSCTFVKYKKVNPIFIIEESLF